MGVHQNRQSKARVRQRRAADKLTTPNLVSCPQCHQLKMQHSICPTCGYYNGKLVIKVSE